ncbi:MAG: hypothetical protein AAF985_08645 [Bacteroidota bacterium]
MNEIQQILARLQNVPHHFRKENIWLGGTIDEEHQWECPANWSLNRVPTEEDSVFILGASQLSKFAPLINSSVPKIFHLLLINHSELRISPAGKLKIHGNAIDDNAIYINNSRLINEGMIRVEHPGQKGIEIINGFFSNQGLLQSHLSEGDLILANNQSIYYNEGQVEILEQDL